MQNKMLQIKDLNHYEVSERCS